MKGRNWDVVWNNPEGLWDLPEGATYLLYQEEVGDSGTHHLQGVVCYKNQVRAKTVQRDFPGSSHRLVRNLPAAIAYCSDASKTVVGGPYEFGEKPKKGRRTDLEVIKESVDQGITTERLWDDHFATMVRYHKSIKEYKRVKTPKRDWPPNILILIGPSGCGKSTTARSSYPNAYWLPPNGKWWDDYDGHETIVFDEFYGHRMPFSTLLQLLDSTPLNLETKGGSVAIVARNYVFTSNQHPKDWYDNEKTHQVSWEASPLNRRITEFGKIIDMTPEDADIVAQTIPSSYTPLMVTSDGQVWTHKG